MLFHRSSLILSFHRQAKEKYHLRGGKRKTENNHEYYFYFPWFVYLHPMTEQWYPQRNDYDGLTATLKTFVHHLKLPISRQLIDDETKSLSQGTNWQHHDIETLLNHWGIETKRLHLTSAELESLSKPVIGFIREWNDSAERTIPIILFTMFENVVTYVHPRKGWIFEEMGTFELKWNKEVIAFQRYNGKGEIDFEQKEREYRQRINNQKGLQVAKWFSNVLSSEECDYIIQLSEDKFGRSKIGDQDTVTDGRTSYSAYLVMYSDEVLNSIRERISHAIGIPTSHFEYFQCVSYDVGQEYQAHYDTFDPTTESGREAIADGGQRAWTMLIYLNDDFVGGQTYFPKLDLLATPEKGCAVMFRNLDKSGKVLPESFHAGLPVSKGRKYALNLWIRQAETNQD